MSSSKGRIARLLGGLLLRRATIVSVENLGGFRRLVLDGDVPKPGAGAKLQVLLSTDDMRTYTPVASPGGAVTLLGWTHARGPGARWLLEAKAGTEVRFLGPQRSLELPPGPVLLVGDETSVAVAASFERERVGKVRAIFQASMVEEVRTAAEAMGLGRAIVLPRADTSSLLDAVVEARTTTPEMIVALTGGSELVLSVRGALRSRGIDDVRTKTYWIPGKSGLD